MAGPEAVFKTWLFDGMPKSDWFMQAIETNTSIGVPDVFFCVEGMSGWMELKATKSKKCFMRVSQYNWFRKYYKQKGLGLLLIKRLTTPPSVDVYTIDDIIEAPVEKCRLAGQDVLFPSGIKPRFSYKLGLGISKLYDEMYRICRRYEALK